MLNKLISTIIIFYLIVIFLLPKTKNRNGMVIAGIVFSLLALLSIQITFLIFVSSIFVILIFNAKEINFDIEKFTSKFKKSKED